MPQIVVDLSIHEIKSVLDARGFAGPAKRRPFPVCEAERKIHQELITAWNDFIVSAHGEGR